MTRRKSCHWAAIVVGVVLGTLAGAGSTVARGADRCSPTGRCADGMNFASPDAARRERREATRHYATLEAGKLLGESWKARIYATNAGQPCYEVTSQRAATGECGRAGHGFIPVIM